MKTLRAFILKNRKDTKAKFIDEECDAQKQSVIDENKIMKQKLNS